MASYHSNRKGTNAERVCTEVSGTKAETTGHREGELARLLICVLVFCHS